MSQQTGEERRSSIGSAEDGHLPVIDGNVELDDVGTSVPEERRDEESEHSAREILEPLKYTALNLDIQDMRFLILIPH